jgi:hypothetical protein
MSTVYALLDGVRVIGIAESTQAPLEPHVALSQWQGVPDGGGPGRELRVESGQLQWVNGEEANAWAVIRQQRDALLAESDWRVTRAMERGLSLASDWLVYRQALRDITDQEDPFNVVWPTRPE